jgi:archaellin
MEMRQYIFLSIVLIILIITAGCTDTSADVPPLPTMSTLPVRGNNPQEILQGFGEVTGQGIPGGTIDTITFTVGLIDSHKSVNMENLTIIYADAIRTESLHPVEGYHGDPPKGFWSITRVENEVGDPNNRLDNEEQFVIRINPKAPLVPRQIITIEIKPPSGHSLTLRRVAPPSIQEDNILLPP